MIIPGERERAQSFIWQVPNPPQADSLLESPSDDRFNDDLHGSQGLVGIAAGRHEFESHVLAPTYRSI